MLDLGVETIGTRSNDFGSQLAWLSKAITVRSRRCIIITNLDREWVKGSALNSLQMDGIKGLLFAAEKIGEVADVHDGEG